MTRDTPWHERQHHDAAGMVGLCPVHHRKADGGAFTVEQFREYKRLAAADAPTVRGTFDWLRRDVALVAGSNFFVECGVAVEVRRRPALWFNRDEDGYALLNVRMPQSGPSRRVFIEDNFWTHRGNVADLVCPPGGKSLDVSYGNGDRLKVEFTDVPDEVTLRRHHPNAPEVALPLTIVEVGMCLPDLGLEFDTRQTRIGTNTMQNCVIMHCGVGLSVN